MVRSGCIASGTTFMTKLEQYYPSQRRVILACFNSKATTGDNHFSDTENNDSVTRKKQQHDCQVEWTDNEKRMRRDAYDILMASIKAVDPYVAVHKRLKCVVRTCSDCDANYAVGNDDQRRQEVNSQKQNADINGGIDSSSCHMNGTKSKGNDQKSVSMLLIESDENQIAPQQENGQFPRHQHFYNAVDYDMVQVIAFGKASYAMANATCEIVKEVMPDARMSGIVIIKDDHATQGTFLYVSSLRLIVVCHFPVQ